jgi:hypothetical protein
MGVSGSTELQINFSCPSLFYFTDEAITGYISFQNTQDKLTLDAIFLEFIGEMEYVTQESRQYYDSNNTAKTENYSKNHVIPFINIRVPVAQPQYGQVKIEIKNK